MTQLLTIHPDNPQSRLITQVARAFESGSVMVLPTDSGYSLCCKIAEKEAVARIRRIRNLDHHHFFTLFCLDFAEISTVARVDNQIFRYLKANTPAPITFILQATKDVPKRLLHPKRRTIGIRIPQNKIMLAILEQLKQPLMSVSVDEPDANWPAYDPVDLLNRYQGKVDLIIDAGVKSVQHTKVVDLTSGVPEIIRQ